jgi:hypothetical protein
VSEETVAFFELDQPVCSRTYGTAPCAAVLGATGTRKCYNTRATCQDPDNYSAVVQTLRFSRPQGGLLQYGQVIPCLADYSTTPGAINLAGMDRDSRKFGQRELVTVMVSDFKHDDQQVDKYRLERETGAAQADGVPVVPYERGTFWGKWQARNPYAPASLRCRIREGLIGQALESMTVREYVLDRVEGPNEGQVKVLLKDLFSLVEARNAVAPFPSSGELLADLAVGVTSATLSPAGVGDAQYPASGYLRIGRECMAFTRAGDALTLTKAQLNTREEDHKAQDTVQLVLQYAAVRPHTIVRDLFLTYGGIDPAAIDATEWDAQAAEITVLYSGFIATPTPVADLVGELCQQAGFSVFPNVSSGMIDLRALRAANSVGVFDDRGIRADGLALSRLTARRVSQCWVYYGQIDPTENLETRRNFRSRVVTVDVDAEGDNQYGTPAIYEIFSRWMPQFARQAATEAGERIVAMHRDPPYQAKVPLHRTDDWLQVLGLGRYVDLEVDGIQDDSGATASITLALTELEVSEDEINATGVQVKFPAVPPIGTERVVYLESDALNVDMRAEWDRQFTAPESGTHIRFIAEAGVQVGSASVDLYALQTGSWPAGVVLTLEMKDAARVQGKGGDGAQGVNPNSFVPPHSAPGFSGLTGQKGGDAILVTYPLTIVMSPTAQIWAGGGGAGSGGQYNDGSLERGGYMPGGGGGAGNVPGGGGYGDTENTPGNPGTTEVGGTGGVDTFSGSAKDGAGGVGGAPGVNGGNGNASATGAPGGAGGPRGRYLVGNALVTWASIGDLRGGVAV